MSTVRYQVAGYSPQGRSKAYYLKGADFPPATTTDGRDQLTAALDYLSSLFDPESGFQLAGIGVEVLTDVPLPAGQSAEEQRTAWATSLGDYTPLFDLVGPLEEA
ncbi:hypothetical protein SEA_AGAPE74_8 [Mycobacterium phage Agape74]|uniref:Uncharacterized protein n=1 Tax=Mycobacterium phage AbbyPaige TaxID=2163589 RepID=A0A2S1PAD5_9CAUD|nr:hypothetical protein SEA_ABBYPAIGE_8 [Mycobacterium phage AbbyPaige]QZE10908.1 hypothetical protein SEA_AGAPE74_8 [Mycobacterium phage Agape74]